MWWSHATTRTVERQGQVDSVVMGTASAIQLHWGGAVLPRKAGNTRVGGHRSTEARTCLSDCRVHFQGLKLHKRIMLKRLWGGSADSCVTSCSCSKATTGRVWCATSFSPKGVVLEAPCQSRGPTAPRGPAAHNCTHQKKGRFPTNRATRPYTVPRPQPHMYH